MTYELNIWVSSTPTKFQKKIFVKYFTNMQRPSGKGERGEGEGGIGPFLIPNQI